MSKPSAKVIGHAIGQANKPIFSIQILAHKFINAEINTHRQTSKSFQSSRAKPVPKTIQQVREDPALPVKWMKNQSGMQASVMMTPEEQIAVEALYRKGADQAADQAERLAEAGLHKQWANRGIEAYMMVPAVLTSTEWENLLALRLSPEAQPEFEYLAEQILKAMQHSRPTFLRTGEWMVPYVDSVDMERFKHKAAQERVASYWDYARQASAARCARVSYNAYDSNRRPTLEQDQTTSSGLIENGHWGPFEHQATPDTKTTRYDPEGRRGRPDEQAWRRYAERNNWVDPHLHGNLVGWCQNRKFYPEELRSFAI